MINHSTLVYHVTNFNTFSRWLRWSDGQIKTLTPYSDPYANSNSNKNPNLNHNSYPNPNEKFELLLYMALSRDVT